MKSLIRLSLWHYLPVVLLVLVTIVVSCNKNGNPNNNSTHTDSTTTTVTNNTYITAKAWKYDTSGLDTNNDGIIDVGGDSTLVPYCERDDLYTFNNDSTGSINTGSLHCTVGEAQTTSFTWSLGSGGKVLKASFNPVLAEGVNILALDTAQFKVEKDSVLLGVTYHYIVQLKH